MAFLVLVRHGQSEWNLKNIFTGCENPDLTELGRAEARAAGQKLLLQKIKFDLAFTSNLIRAQKTLEIILQELKIPNLLVIKNKALNERNYGELTGKNKDEARKEFGEKQVQIWRRSFDIAPPGGESLKDTADRVLPFFENKILPKLKNRQNIIIVAHGNSLRALIMYLKKLSPIEIIKVEIATGKPLIYKI
jgi:2,3-bisphosphoglycerate-dependent phosphoglycerate mutase